MHDFNSKTQEVDGSLQVPGQAKIHSETLSQRTLPIKQILLQKK